MKSRAYELAQVIVWAAVYSVGGLIPLSTFIGGSGMITAQIVLLPVIVACLCPSSAVLAIVIGSLATAAVNLSVYSVFGLLGLLIPFVGVVFGVFQKMRWWLLPAVWLLLESTIYVQLGGTSLWLVPYVFAIIMTAIGLYKSMKLLGIVTVTTISELAMMNLLSLVVLQLPPEVWTIITPFMYYERAIAIIGSMLLVKGIQKYAPRFVALEVEPWQKTS